VAAGDMKLDAFGDPALGGDALKVADELGIRAP
jgi:hypothetical protein